MRQQLRIIPFGVQHLLGLALCALVALPTAGFARDIRHDGQEIDIYVSPNEPTEIKFPERVSMGYKRRDSVLTIDKRENDLVVFSHEGIRKSGEAILVKLEDGRSYSLRVKRAQGDTPRDSIVRVLDKRGAIFAGSEEELPEYLDRKFPKAKPTKVSGLMREMVLAAEFGKSAIPGYKTTDRFQGETVLNDGTLDAKIDKIFIGPNLWGYVLNASNLLDEGQRLNPASFRLDGTRAISVENWELAPRPLNIEQQIAGKHQTKVYIITRAKKTN